MNFIDFLEEGKINNKDLEFKDNRFIIGDKTYFFAEKKGKYINNVLDSERRPTDFRLYQFDKNSAEWCIAGPCAGKDGENGELPKKVKDLTGYRISVKDDKISFYFRKLSAMEIWSVCKMSTLIVSLIICFAASA